MEFMGGCAEGDIFKKAFILFQQRNCVILVEKNLVMCLSSVGVTYNTLNIFRSYGTFYG